MLDTTKTPFGVDIRAADGELLYCSWHRTPQAAARRLASIINRPRQWLPAGKTGARFFVEDYQTHDSGAAFNLRSLVDLRRCYELSGAPR